MVAPTLVSVFGNPTPSATQTTTGLISGSPGTVSITWATGDLLVVVATNGNGSQAFGTPTATGLTFTAAGSETATVNNGTSMGWTATAAGSGSAVSLSLTQGSTSGVARFSITVFRFSGASGFGTAAQTVNNSGSTDTTLVQAITTVQANSAILYAVADWTAVSQPTPTYNTTVGTPTQELNGFNSGDYSCFVAVYADAGAVGAKTVGVTSGGTTMRKASWALEILGSTAAVTVAKTSPRNRARFRASFY